MMEGHRLPPKTIDELQKSRETRANDALAMKEQQLRMLNDQNVQLLRNLDSVAVWIAGTILSPASIGWSMTIP